MADIDVSSESSGKGHGVKKAKKLSTKVDMTPMVDLGFLLITFFIFTTTMKEPSSLPLPLPNDKIKTNEKSLVQNDAVITILAGKDDKLYYYEADDPLTMQVSNFKDIRDVILKKRTAVHQKYPNPTNNPKKEKFFVIIRPTNESTYKNTVDLIDEMVIDNVKNFSMEKPTTSELAVINKFEENN